MDTTERTRAAAAELRAQLREEQETLRERYERDRNAAKLLRGRCRLVDRMLHVLWRLSGLPDSMALVAVGGYGRGELYPHSDIDLLFLTPGRISGSDAEGLERLVGLAWDIGLELGHAVRTLSECLVEAERDITIQTSLLEARFLTGSRALFGDLRTALSDALSVPAFFTAKRLEQEERYSRYDDTPYSLEPNCKESPGGLRDLQMILWIAQAAGLGGSWTDLVARGVIAASEAARLRRGESFLRHLRIHLHYLARRREDRIVFDHQEALARAFRIKPTAAKRGSEILMQRYYRNAKLVTQLNTIVRQNLALQLLPASRGAAFSINARFQMERGLLDIADDEVFKREPSAILEAFLLMEQRSELKGMTARTLRALWRDRNLIDAKFRRDPRNRASFIALLQARRGIATEFRRMNQWGILGRYLPVFRRIVGQMQHDLFHVYTVDQHILQVLRNVRRFTLSEHAHEYPFCSRLITGFEKTWIVLIAALFHDIAKGRGGDHSLLGRDEVRRFCRVHGMGAEDTEMASFLVEHHLTMSRVAQKQDLGDPNVIRAFADLMKTEERLTALYLLTHADIRGTSPKVWNSWKAKLLEDLFRAAQGLLRGRTPLQALGISERQEEARKLLRFHGLRPGVESALWQNLDTVYFMRHGAEEIAWHTRVLQHRAESALPVVKARLSQHGEGLEVVVYTRDEPELFVRLCGFFARLGFSIVDAKIHTTRHGYALDSFMLLDPTEQANYRDTISLIEHDLAERLRLHAPPDTPRAARLSRQVRHFPIAPEITIRPDERGGHHLMAVTAADRPGLLYSIAQVLARHKIDLHTAKIATLGERAEDVFLISGAELGNKATLLKLEQELFDQLAVR
jgi:[protein-PII] uridylyltransferase